MAMARPGISLQDLVDTFHLSQDQLDREVSEGTEEHLREVARIIDDHEIVGYELGLRVWDEYNQSRCEYTGTSKGDYVEELETDLEMVFEGNVQETHWGPPQVQ